MKFASMTLLALLSTTAFARVDFNQLLDEEMANLSSVAKISSYAYHSGANANCKRKYDDLYSKAVIKVSYGFGYGDTPEHDIIWDALSYNGFYKHIRQPCPTGVVLCGFTPDRKDKNLLRKAIGYGGQSKIIELRITKASFSRSRRANETGLNAAMQIMGCFAAKDKFMKEVAEGADIVFYNGHSRDGGGPDFCPAIRRDSDDHVNYDWYHKNRPGIIALTDALKKAKDAKVPNDVVGMFSCSSQLHFQRRIQAASPSAGLILTKRTATFEETMQDSYAALDGLLAQRCSEGFSSSFDRRKATHLVNMFPAAARKPKTDDDLFAEQLAYDKSFAELNASLKAEGKGELEEGYIPVPTEE